MQTPLDIGADVSKDYVIVACAKQSLRSSKLVNKRAALLPWLLGVARRVCTSPLSNITTKITEPPTRNTINRE